MILSWEILTENPFNLSSRSFCREIYALIINYSKLSLLVHLPSVFSMDHAAWCYRQRKKCFDSNPEVKSWSKILKSKSWSHSWSQILNSKILKTVSHPSHDTKYSCFEGWALNVIKLTISTILVVHDCFLWYHLVIYFPQCTIFNVENI